jgi:hypothetical protein
MLRVYFTDLFKGDISLNYNNLENLYYHFTINSHDIM